MSIFRTRTANYLVPVHPDNATTKDWAILLEAGTIVGPSPQRIRVAQSMQDKKIKRRYDILLRAKYFIFVEGFNPRIHTLYFCPQLYRYDTERKLVPLQGEEIGQLIAQAAEAGVTARRPWYEPSEKLPDLPPINTAMLNEFDTVVVEMPDARSSNAAASQPVLAQINRDNR
jgi:hypothetical protein